MNQKRIISIVCIVIIVIFTGTKWASGASFYGDGTYTMNGDSYILLNNGISITLGKIDKLEEGAGMYGSPVGVYKYPSEAYRYPGGPEVGTLLVIDNTNFIFLSPTNPEQQIIERGNSNDFTHPGVVMKLISVNKDRGEANISFQSIKGNINLNNPSLMTPAIVIIMAILVFFAEFIIKKKSTNVLYRYTFFRSIIYTIPIPILLLAFFSDSDYGGLSAILIIPFIFIESLIVSFVAYKIVIKRK